MARKLYSKTFTIDLIETPPLMCIMLKIPLNTEEVRTLQLASAHLSHAYFGCFNGLFSISRRLTILAALKANMDMIREIRREVDTSLCLTEFHVGDIEAIKTTFHQEMSDLCLLIPQEFAESDKTGCGMDIREMEQIRHSLLGKIHNATQPMDKLFQMVEQKLARLAF